MTEQLLDQILESRATLMEHVSVLEKVDGIRPGRRYDALQGLLDLVCADLTKFRSHRYKNLAAVMGDGDGDGEPQVSKKFESSACYDAAYGIGVQLTKHADKKWRAADQFVDLYGELARKLPAAAYQPLLVSDLPTSLRKLQEKACNLSKKLRKSSKLTLDEERLAIRIAKRVIPIMLVVATLISLEQDADGFTADLKTAVTFLLHEIRELATDDTLDNPPPESKTSHERSGYRPKTPGDLGIPSRPLPNPGSPSRHPRPNPQYVKGRHGPDGRDESDSHHPDDVGPRPGLEGF